MADAPLKLKEVPDMRLEPLSGGETASEAEQIAPLATSLSRIANALGVSVSSFREPNSAYGSEASITDLEATTLLTLVEAHLRRLDAEAQTRFVERLQALIAVERR